MFRDNRTLAALALSSMLLASAGCSKKTVKKDVPSETPIAALPPAVDSGIAPLEAEPDAEPSLRNSVWQNIPGLAVIHFSYDSDALDEKARNTLAANAKWLKDNPDVKVQVTGHCDQRGTVEYNLALGQRRAKAVREYYKSLGLSGGRVATISFGEEKGLCAEESESCWTKNRRAETLAAFPKDMSQAPGSGAMTP